MQRSSSPTGSAATSDKHDAPSKPSHKAIFLPIKTPLGTTPVDPQDRTSHAVIYRYTLPYDASGRLADVTQATARENVLDFFYPHTLKTSGEGTTKTQESLDWLKMRRDVFLLAFQAVQGLDHDDKWSFFQIAAIHGLPHAPYDGDEGDWDPSNPEWWGGYCQHGTPLFPTWHRPYMMLLEQSIIRQAKLFADTLSQADEKQAVLDMADKLRIPYWDWACQSTRVLGLPEVFTSTEITLSYAWKSFSTTSIPNPLKSFIFPVNVGKPVSSSDVFNPTAKPNYVVPAQGTPFSPENYPTVRYVDAAYTSQNDKLNVNLIRNANTTLVEGVHAMFQHNQWLPFSNHFWSEETHGDGSQFGHYSSLELVHDFVHRTVGGPGGQMTYPETAAFDPIFFFHHANVDRLVALWQYIYPDAWIPAKPLQLDSEGTYTDAPDSEANASTHLTPFRLANEGARFVTSNDVRLVDADCGYSYPEILLARKEGWTEAKMYEHAMKMYEPPQNFLHRWVLVVDRILKRAFNGPFDIRVFLDKPDADAKTPTSIPNFAGEITVFARSTGARCANCEKQKCMRASLDLTKTMLRLGITTTSLLSSDADPFSSQGGPPANPLSAPGSLKLIFVDLQGNQLDPSTAIAGWDGPKISLYYQEGIPIEDVNEFPVQSINVTPSSPKKPDISTSTQSIDVAPGSPQKPDISTTTQVTIATSKHRRVRYLLHRIRLGHHGHFHFF